MTQSWPFIPLVLIASELLLKITNSEEKIFKSEQKWW